MTASRKPIDYDTTEGIARYLSRGLAGLNELAKDRCEAGYCRNERMREFYVLGAWGLDTCGNFGRISEVTSGDYRVKHKSIREVVKGLPDVIEAEDFWVATQKNPDIQQKVSIGVSHGHFLPSANVVCPECGEGWRLDNATDCVVTSECRSEPAGEHVGKTLAALRAIYETRTDGDWRMGREIMVRNDRWIDMSPVPGYDTLKKNERGWVGSAENKRRAERDGGSVDPDAYVVAAGDETDWNVWTYRHGECNKARRASAALERVTEAFGKAGFKTVKPRAIKNRYCSCELCAPWYAVETEVGLIVVGSRKSVVNIDWSATEIDLLGVFDSEDVTKEAHFIHAWGWEKVAEYLGKIREGLTKAGAKAYAPLGRERFVAIFAEEGVDAEWAGLVYERAVKTNQRLTEATVRKSAKDHAKDDGF